MVTSLKDQAERSMLTIPIVENRGKWIHCVSCVGRTFGPRVSDQYMYPMPTFEQQPDEVLGFLL